MSPDSASRFEGRRWRGRRAPRAVPLSDLETVSSRTVEEVSTLSSSSVVVIQTVAARGARVAARKIRTACCEGGSPVRDPRPAMRGRSARRTRASSGPQCVISLILAAQQVDQVVNADADLGILGKIARAAGAQVEAQPEVLVGRNPIVLMVRLSKHQASVAPMESPSTVRGALPSWVTENFSSHRA